MATARVGGAGTMPRPTSKSATMGPFVADGKTALRIVARAGIVLLLGRGLGRRDHTRGAAVEAGGVALASAPDHPPTKKLTVDELPKHDNFTR